MSPRTNQRWLLAGILCLFVAGTVGGCAAPTIDSGASSTTTSTSLSVNAPMDVGFGSGSIGAPNPTSTVPTNGGRPITPALFDAGQNIVITNQGFEPQELEASVTAPIVWTNLSGAPQRLVFAGVPVDSGTIPVGGTFSWTPGGAVALSYRSSSGWYGKLQVNQSQL